MTSWKKSLIAIWIMQFLAMLGMAQFLPMLPLYIQTLGVKDVGQAARWSGLIFGVGFLFAGLMAPLWGHLADQWGRKRMVIRAMLGSAAALALMAFSRNVQDLLLLRILHGSLGGFVSATTALVATLVPESRLGFAIGSSQSALTVGIILGPVLGGLWVDALGFRPMILFSAGLLVIGTLVMALLVPDDRAFLSKNRSSGLLDNFRTVLSSRALLAASGIQFLVQTALMAIHPVMALFVKTISPSPERAASLTGLIFGATAAAAFVGSAFMGRQVDRWGNIPVLRLCLLGAALVYVPQAFVAGVGALVSWRLFTGIFSGGIQPAVNSLVARSAPADRRAGVLGVTFACSLFGNALGPVLGGTAASMGSLRSPFLVTAGLLLLAWVLSRFMTVPAQGSSTEKAVAVEEPR